MTDPADRLWSDRRTLAAGASEDLDLAGALADPFGAALNFSRIRGLLIAADPSNTNSVVVGGASSNGFASWVGDDDAVIVRPGGVLVLVAPDATDHAVTPGTPDLLRIANSRAGAEVTYDVEQVRASA
jgi:hypothetical protein